MEWCQRWVLGILGISAVSGCAFGDRHVALAYPPPAEQTIALPARPALTTPTVALQNFADVRSKLPIGEVRNGFGMHTADVLAQGSVAQWVTDAVAYELKAVGVRVHRLNGRPPSPGEIVVSGQIVRFYCTALMSYEAEVSFIGQLSVNSQLSFTGHLSGNGGSGVNWGATESAYGESLAAALQDAVRRFIVQIYPIVTMPPSPAPQPPPLVEPAALPRS